MSDEEVPPPVKYNSLRNFVKKQEEDMRAGGEAVEELQAEMEFFAKAVWLHAADHARDDDRSTVKRRDVQDAYDELFEPHDLLIDIADRVAAMSRELEREAMRSPAFPELTPDDQ